MERYARLINQLRTQSPYTWQIVYLPVGPPRSPLAIKHLHQLRTKSSAYPDEVT